MRLICIILIFLPFISNGQKVGVVLSGGGAAGAAHVGVLKALELNDIPIDYIVGTSVGALIGGFYAAGYTPAEIEKIITSNEFRNSANGIIEGDKIYFIKKSRENASIVNVNFSLDSIMGSNLPTNFVSPVAIDYGLMEFFSSACAAADNNFDSLMIPFRALSANITNQKQSILKSGNLSTAIRASMTYPFYIPPVSIDGNLMFDGGLYNNFPVDIMCTEFFPDYIIASNVASKNQKPTEDNLISQLRNILTKETNFQINCSKGIIINTNVDDVSTFDFYDSNSALERGYQSTILLLDSIKGELPVSRRLDEVQYKRNQFRNKLPPLVFDSIRFDGIFRSQSRYFKRQFKLNTSGVSSTNLQPAYYRLISNEKIKTAYPEAIYNKESGKFDLKIGIKKEKSFKASFGGVLSTKPISTGFFQLEHQLLRSTELKTSGNVYFGNFYNSLQAKTRWDIPFDIPFYVQAQFTKNNFDYFSNRTNFFNENTPPFIITSESYFEGSVGLPVFTNGKIVGGYNYFWQDYQYYQSTDFSRIDTSDQTKFEGYKTFIAYQRNTLNRKQFATKGNQLTITMSGYEGREETNPGSTSPNKFKLNKRRDWIDLGLKIDKYFFNDKKFHLGTYAEIHYSDIPGFHNPTITNLTTPGFSPLPENQTLFLPRYRSKSFTALGLKAIYSYRDQLDFRLEGYFFQPNENLKFENYGLFGIGEKEVNQNLISTFTAVYFSRLGQLAGSVNYYESSTEDKFSFIVHFGYIIFNKKAFD